MAICPHFCTSSLEDQRIFIHAKIFRVIVKCIKDIILHSFLKNCYSNTLPQVPQLKQDTFYYLTVLEVSNPTWVSLSVCKPLVPSISSRGKYISLPFLDSRGSLHSLTSAPPPLLSSSKLATSHLADLSIYGDYSL